ncbi:hypothetical protein GDO78_003397 [Eleutherodactylus coqui]|uniref:Uncharacterized protein n=1 Tax=Eleutherodactylus coqui TaxID=57060 RepID=A0A8J6ET76_ELECQ|nr:hypothetical protein GDO78_003397 [Eleutherodactylus coqui]
MNASMSSYGALAPTTSHYWGLRYIQGCPVCEYCKKGSKDVGFFVFFLKTFLSSIVHHPNLFASSDGQDAHQPQEHFFISQHFHVLLSKFVIVLLHVFYSNHIQSCTDNAADSHVKLLHSKAAARGQFIPALWA